MNAMVDWGTGLVYFGHMRGRVDLDLDVDEWHAKDPGLRRDGFRFVGRDGTPVGVGSVVISRSGFSSVRPHHEGRLVLAHGDGLWALPGAVEHFLARTIEARCVSRDRRLP